MRILMCIGTRPEAIKMLPLALELRKNSGFDLKICHSGQHGKMADSVFEFFKIKPDYYFNGVKSGVGLLELTNQFLKYFDMVFEQEKPDMVLVHGDTTTALCASLTAFYRGIKIGHVEAGLRTYDAHSPFPEEFNRVSIDAMSDICFAPTRYAADNLIKEAKKSVFTTGNTVIDSFKFTLDDEYRSELFSEARGRKTVLLTSHRRESLGDKMRSSFLGVRRVLVSRDDLLCIFPMHPNPAVRGVAESVFCNVKNIKICEPLPLYDFHNILSRSIAVITDSGGIQEEAAYLGIPIFLLRESTERREALESGSMLVVGNDEKKVANEILAALNDPKRLSEMQTPTDIFGDGHASERISNILKDFI